MPRYLVQYTHVEETTYKQWVEASSEEEALKAIKGAEIFESVVGNQGLALKNYEVTEVSTLSPDEAFNKAMEAAGNVLGVDPAYYGEEGTEEVEKQLNKLGYTLKELRGENS